MGTNLRLCDNCKSRYIMCCICSDNSHYREGKHSIERMIRKQAITDFVEHITLPLTTEEDITKILEQLKEE